MVTLDFLIAACLDPVQAALVLAILVAYRGFQPVLVGGAAAAVITETIMTLWAADYAWGEWIAPRFVAALMQAVVLFWSIGMLRKAAKSAGAALGGRRLSTGGAATLEAHGPRPAPWHMRAYVRRHRVGLRSRKIQP